MSDEQLVSRVISGDQDAIVFMFYEKFASIFQYHIYKIFPNKMDVQELVDEFFLYLYEDDWRRLRTYNGSTKLSTWISVVSLRFFRNYKLAKLDFNGAITISDKWESYCGDWIDSKDVGIGMDLQEAIDSIENDRDRDIAKLIILKDIAPEDIAKQFGLTIDHVYTIKNRFIKQLRNKLASYQK